MSHGGPDWGLGRPVKTIYTVQDMGELAVRLGSIVSFDRRGNVIWFDDFEHSLNKWYVSIAGSGGSAVISNDKARTGALSCKVVTGDETDDLAMIRHIESYLTLSKWGVEFSFLANETKAVLILRLEFYAGDYVHVAGIKYDFETNTWYYGDSGGGWTALSFTLILTPSLYMFHTLKLVIDPSTQKYVRLLADSDSLDMSALSYGYEASSSSPEARIELFFYPKEDASKTVYYDDFIFTQNEP